MHAQLVFSDDKSTTSQHPILKNHSMRIRMLPFLTRIILFLSQIRKHRTLTELVTDAQEVCDAGVAKAAISVPKKPLTPYFRYFMAKQKKTAAANPDASMTDISKFLAKEYTELSDKKKVTFV
jgi:hypothetical protein